MAEAAAAQAAEERGRDGRFQEIEAEAEPEPPEATLSLSTASFDELRGLGFSVTQVKRVIQHREERGGFKSVGELDRIPGFPKAFLTEVKGRLAA